MPRRVPSQLSAPCSVRLILGLSKMAGGSTSGFWSINVESPRKRSDPPRLPQLGRERAAAGRLTGETHLANAIGQQALSAGTSDDGNDAIGVAPETRDRAICARFQTLHA
jgi:hypothetical protein